MEGAWQRTRAYVGSFVITFRMELSQFDNLADFLRNEATEEAGCKDRITEEEIWKLERIRFLASRVYATKCTWSCRPCLSSCWKSSSAMEESIMLCGESSTQEQTWSVRDCSLLNLKGAKWRVKEFSQGPRQPFPDYARSSRIPWPNMLIEKVGGKAMLINFVLIGWTIVRRGCFFSAVGFMPNSWIQLLHVIPGSVVEVNGVRSKPFASFYSIIIHHLSRDE